MKKLLSSLFAMLLVIGLVAGCGGGGGDKKAEGDKKAPEKANLILATGGTSGTYYPLGGAMAQIWNSKSNGTLNVTAQSTGAAVENLRLINKEDVELAIVQSDTMDYAYKGTEVFKDGKLENVRAIAYMYPEIIQIVVRADSGINSIADLKGKSVGVGAPGSGTEANFRQLIDIFGLTYDDLKPQYLSFSESADRFKDNQVDAFLVVAGLPNSAIMDIATQHKIKVLSISDDMIEKINKKYPFLSGAVIPANTYTGQTEDTKTVAVMATLVAGAKVKDDIIYNVTKIMFENLNELGQGHAKGKEVKLETATKSMTIPFHPGAEKYFKEKGVLK